MVVGAPFLPLAVLLYWVSNNLWTLGQQYVVYKRIDAEEADEKAQAVADRQARAPQTRSEAGPAPRSPPSPRETPGAKPVTQAYRSTHETLVRQRLVQGKDSSVKDTASTNGATTTGAATQRHRPRRPEPPDAPPRSAADPD